MSVCLTPLFDWKSFTWTETGPQWNYVTALNVPRTKIDKSGQKAKIVWLSNLLKLFKILIKSWYNSFFVEVLSPSQLLRATLLLMRSANY